MISNYHHKFKEIFEAIGRKLESKDPSILTAEYIFPNSRDPNLELLKVYIWLIKEDTSNLILANKASKVLPKEGVVEFEKILEKREFMNSKELKKAYPNKPLPFNPNFLIPKYEKTWVPPTYFKKPPWHKVGDRVVNLKINGKNFAPFGATGTVIGILGNKPENGVWEVKIEVMFDHPFVGGSNLGGRCTWGRGAVVDFDDIFNMACFDKFVRPRDRRKHQYYEGWDGVITRSYVPSFQTTTDPEEAEAKATEKKGYNIVQRDQQGQVNAPAGDPNQLKQLQEFQSKIQTSHQQHGPQNPLDQLKQVQQMSSQIKSQNQTEQVKQFSKQIKSQNQNEQFQQLQQFTTQIKSQNQNEQNRQLQDFTKQINKQNQSAQNKQLQEFTSMIQTQNTQAPKSTHQAQDQTQQFKQLYEFTNQIQSNQGGYSQPKANTFIPKTLKVKQQNPQPQGGYQQNQPQGGRPQGQGQQGGDFNFNSFLSSNLAQAYQGTQTTVTPSTSSTEGFLKEALKLPGSTEQQPAKPKKALKLGAQSYAAPPQESQNPQPTSEGATQNALQNLFMNAQLLNQNTGAQNIPGGQPVMNVEQIEKNEQNQNQDQQ